MMDLHFLRPWWFLMLLPTLWLFSLLFRRNPDFGPWAAICDRHLLKHLIQEKTPRREYFVLLCLFLSILAMIISLAGPTWSRLPTPAYKQKQARILVLDLSGTMLANDLSPDRLTRAKFKLHDLFKRPNVGQLAMIVYTAEPFVVSPLTDDAQTIDSLLSSLSPEIMPIDGQNLSAALLEAEKLVINAGFNEGEILVMTGERPDQEAISTARALSRKRIHVSIMPILANDQLNPSFQALAKAGRGQVLLLSNAADDLEQWLRIPMNKEMFALSKEDELILWRDQGRWFLLAALLLLLPVFRRGCLE